MFHHLQAYLQGFQLEIVQHRYALALAVATVAAIGVALWALASRKRYIVLRSSNESEALMLQLGRIAAALERLNARHDVPDFSSQEILRPGPVDEPAESRAEARVENRVEEHVAPAPLGHVGVGSMFSFSRRAELPNPLYRPK
ncbi:MAG TPA: hypothetical protein VGR93_10715 [Candidatus Acidoferrales bacterium]|nr:hypothetical protein [Candidatus Acidoferrales bacterium]